MDLLKKKCVPCEGGATPLTSEEAKNYIPEVEGWELIWESNPDAAAGAGKITKTFKFADFIGAINFVERVADVAEMEDHHPDIHVYYNKVVLDLWTHAIGGLSENDFIGAAKINYGR